MAPQADPLQPEPARLQVTAVFVVLLTIAVNCWCPPVSSCAVVGEMLTVTGATTVTVAVADFVESATEVAVIRT